MSYEIIKSIVIKDGNKVFIRASSNNIYPKDFKEQYSESLTKLLAEKGEQEFNIIILTEYENGNFQSPASINNKWTRALKVLYYLYTDEYQRFNWRNNLKYDSPEYHEHRKLRESDEFKTLLNKCLNTKPIKAKFIIIKRDDSNPIYAYKETKRHLFYTRDLSKAKRFVFKQEAENTAKRFGLDININCEIAKLCENKGEYFL